MLEEDHINGSLEFEIAHLRAVLDIIREKFGLD